ncbi:di-trans,poly-cis-decaprenylcistransferase [Candidatus Curtissbacteria bacterium]|nr:di-trans,poly-cis-decaprenylcistransferase [Candidatus Curtissbacteria bacterium]MBI2594213.1 di-trans,poly-cis-decaprenylcistransferase [Candidatus Curtissbacteria bacterium]
MKKKTNRLAKTNGEPKSPFGPEVILPKHIVLIPDGNRRWAKERGLPIEEGHRRGMDNIVEISRVAQDWGIKYLTIWAFSTENWNRSPREIRYLMRVFKDFIKKFLREFLKKGVKISHLGRKDRIPKFLREALDEAMSKTKNNDKFFVNIALDYGGRDEILRAVKKILSNGPTGKKISEAEFSKYLDTNGQPEPDLIIRTSGEKRLSGMMPFQAAYAELYFEKVYLPEFTPYHLKKAILDYSNRQRRFGT